MSIAVSNQELDQLMLQVLLDATAQNKQEEKQTAESRVSNHY